jgi:hypothetical protein
LITITTGQAEGFSSELWLAGYLDESFDSNDHPITGYRRGIFDNLMIPFGSAFALRIV